MPSCDGQVPYIFLKLKRPIFTTIRLLDQVIFV